MSLVQLTSSGQFRTKLPYGTYIRSHNTGASNLSVSITNATLYPGRTYYFKSVFRCRGDGTSTASKCSSIGFIAYWNNWAGSRNYCLSSADSYARINSVVTWTYSFTVDSQVTPTSTSIYWIIENGWANGNDGQTIDLYYYKYWDSLGNIYNEVGDASVLHSQLNVDTVWEL